MKLLTISLIGSMIALFSLTACNPSSTTDGRPNRGGKVTSDNSANQQRGGEAADWSQGSGQPGSAPSPHPSNQAGKAEGRDDQEKKDQRNFGTTAGAKNSETSDPNAPGSKNPIPGR